MENKNENKNKQYNDTTKINNRREPHFIDKSTIMIETTIIDKKENDVDDDYKLNLDKLEEYYGKNDKNKVISVNLEIINR